MIEKDFSLDEKYTEIADKLEKLNYLIQNFVDKFNILYISEMNETEKKAFINNRNKIRIETAIMSDYIFKAITLTKELGTIIKE